MSIRTDLISEIKSENPINIDGVVTNTKQTNNTFLSTIKITNDTAAKIIGKPQGTYCTISFPRLDYICDTFDIINSTLKALKIVYHKNVNCALVVGLGNADITPDALGPLACSRILATRHLSGNLKRDLGLQNLKNVCCISPNVLGKTGIESYDVINAVSDKIKPDIIIAIDALACREADRLCRTVQISNSGIIAGSGVNNSRKELSKSTLGVPVIAIGVPTVIDANSFFDSKENMMVTPKEIDLLVEKAADIISRAINLFLQPDIDIDIIESLT